ncbi:MAG: DUF4350 domain-containing protein [Leptolyngbyaceae cyanobacterium]
MTRTLPLRNRYVLFALVGLVLLFALLVVLAPATGRKTSGSTYTRSPEGYLGWFDYMAAQGTPVQRWRQPLSDLLDQIDDRPQTLLRIFPGMVEEYRAWEDDWLEAWLEAGNSLIVLGVDAQIQDIPFTTRLPSDGGEVVIKTRRRDSIATNSERSLLGDTYGAVVWQRTEAEAGRLILALTPHLAANAYLTAPGNFAFLADLATQAGGPIWVDEYLHGYTAAEAIVTETVNTWGAYLARTPVKVALVQIVILLALFLSAQNRRLGNLTLLKAPKVDNSQAYIEALAAVLHKAESSQFLVDTLAKAERSRLQRNLGLHATHIEDATLQTAWSHQTGRSPQALTPLLRPPRVPPKSADGSLKMWLEKLRHLRQISIRP